MLLKEAIKAVVVLYVLWKGKDIPEHLRRYGRRRREREREREREKERERERARERQRENAEQPTPPLYRVCGKSLLSPLLALRGWKEYISQVVEHEASPEEDLWELLYSHPLPATRAHRVVGVNHCNLIVDLSWTQSLMIV